MIESSIEDSVEIFIRLIRKAYEGLGYKQEQDFERSATRKYLENIREDFGQVRVLGMKERVTIDSLYVRANILEKISITSGDLPSEMEQNRESFHAGFSKTIETVDGEEILNRNENLIVLGKPGAGKTTYLKYLTLRMATLFKGSQIKQHRLPIFVLLHEFAKSGKTLLDHITEQFDYCSFEHPKHFIELLLINGDCLILLDGLDEVSRETYLDAVIQEVSIFTRKYRKSRFVISCRIAAYNHWFDNQKFKDVEIADFNKGQIENFVERYFSKEPEIGKSCWDKLKVSNSLLDMAKLPFLLSLLCNTYYSRKEFAPNRALLYYHTIKDLINTWDESRLIKRDKLYKDLDEPRLLNLLSRIAAGYFEADVYFVGEEDLKKGVSQFLVDIIGEKARNKGGQVLQDIEQHYGLIVRRSKYAFSFSHLTFMEYFTAQYIVDNALKGSIMGLVEKHFGDARWLEVFLFVAEKLGNRVDLLLELILDKNQQTLIKDEELNNQLRVVQKSILIKESVFKRIELEWIAFYFCLSNTGFSGSAIMDAVLSARGLDHALGNDVALELDLGYHFESELDYKCFKIYLKEENLQNLIKYIKGNTWLAQILSSQADISIPMREKVLANMFTPANQLEAWTPLNEGKSLDSHIWLTITSSPVTSE